MIVSEYEDELTPTSEMLSTIKRELTQCQKDKDELRESLDDESEKLSEYENDMDTIKTILHEVGGCDGEEGYAKGWDKAVNEIEKQMIEHLVHFKH